MKKEELATLLNVSRNTLSNWEKDKPDLVRLINQGLALDQSIEETKKHLERLEQIKDNASSGKFNLKGK